MTCHMCGKTFRTGDGYAFYRDDMERICSRCHAGWFGSKFHQEHILQAEEIKPKTAEERITDCKHTIQRFRTDPFGEHWNICEECGKHTHI